MQFKCQSITGPEAFPDPLDYVSHPLGKLKAVGDILIAMACQNERAPLAEINRESTYGLGEIISDAVEDIEMIVDAAMGITPKKKPKAS